MGSLHPLFLTLCIFLLLTEAHGGDKATLRASYRSDWRDFVTSDATTMTDDFGSHRQDVCGRYDDVRHGKLDLKWALADLKLHPIFVVDDYFNYTEQDGISDADPSLLANIMDELAKRGNFTWRDSFAVMPEPQYMNISWTEALFWSVETFDISVSWWFRSTERMEAGVTFMEPYSDSSLIMIDKPPAPVDIHRINLSNWTKPFEPHVWLMIIFTILLSGLVYQAIESLSDERAGRSMKQWFSDNLYLSLLNFTQNYEYAPNSPAGRIFGVSMAVWSLVMTATYTANLASFFVETSGPAVRPTSIEHAVRLGQPICTRGVPNAVPDAFSEINMILKRAPRAQLVLRPTDEEIYQALNTRKCDVAAVNKDSFMRHERQRAFNPDCDLEWVGRAIETIEASFAVKADAGYLCTSLIRDVLDLHMIQMISDGTLAKIWEIEFSRHDDNHCADDDTNDDNYYGEGEERQLTEVGFKGIRGGGETTSRRNISAITSARTRQLKAAAASASASAASDPNADAGEALTIYEMLGTFVLHWSVMLGALLLAAVTKHKKKLLKNLPTLRDSQTQLRFRNNGPIIGVPPRLNTYVTQGVLGDEEAGKVEFEHMTGHSRCDCRTLMSGFGGMNNSATASIQVEFSSQQAFKELQEDMRESRVQQEAVQEEIRATRRQQEEMAKQMRFIAAWMQQSGSIVDERAPNAEKSSTSTENSVK